MFIQVRSDHLVYSYSQDFFWEFPLHEMSFFHGLYPQTFLQPNKSFTKAILQIKHKILHQKYLRTIQMIYLPLDIIPLWIEGNERFHLCFHEVSNPALADYGDENGSVFFPSDRYSCLACHKAFLELLDDILPCCFLFLGHNSWQDFLLILCRKLDFLFTIHWGN